MAKSEIGRIEDELKSSVYRAVCEIEGAYGIDLEGDGLQEVTEIFLRKCREQDHGARNQGWATA